MKSGERLFARGVTLLVPELEAASVELERQCPVPRRRLHEMAALDEGAARGAHIADCTGLADLRRAVVRQATAPELVLDEEANGLGVHVRLWARRATLSLR